MERKKVQRAAPPAYPPCEALTPVLARRIALAAALATAPWVGCDWIGHEVDGLLRDSSEGWSVRLPDEGAHTVVFPDDQGEIDYHVDAEVQSLLVDCLTQDAAAHLVAIDAVLLSWPIADFADGSALVDAEVAVLEALALGCDASTESFFDVGLVLDDVHEPDGPDTGG